MNKMKISLLAVIAILAMSFTVISHKGGIGKTENKKAQVFVCQPDQGQGKYFRAYKSCTTGQVKEQKISPCTPPGHAQFDCATNLVPNLQPYTCPGGPRFCCAFAPQRVQCAPNGCIRVQVFCMP